jgi:hypothetical protein
MNSRRIIGNPLKKLPKEHKFAVEIRNKEPLCNQNFNGLSRQCPTRRPEGGCPAS